MNFNLNKEGFIAPDMKDLAWKQADVMARKQGGKADDYFDMCYDSLLEISNEE